LLPVTVTGFWADGDGALRDVLEPAGSVASNSADLGMVP
jgi:hypothetical protein